MPVIYRAKHGFATSRDGVNVHVRAGDTVAAGHWLLDTNSASFEPLTPTFNVEKQPERTPEPPKRTPEASRK